MKHIASILLCTILSISLLSACSKPVQPLTAAELLDLGEKYLLELNYEQALVQFLAVIEIEPMNPRGYTGAAEAYLGLGREEEAVAILRQGYEFTGNIRLFEQMESLSGSTNSEQRDTAQVDREQSSEPDEMRSLMGDIMPQEITVLTRQEVVLSQFMEGESAKTTGIIYEYNQHGYVIREVHFNEQGADHIETYEYNESEQRWRIYRDDDLEDDSHWHQIGTGGGIITAFGGRVFSSPWPENYFDRAYGLLGMSRNGDKMPDNRPARIDNTNPIGEPGQYLADREWSYAVFEYDENNYPIRSISYNMYGESGYTLFEWATLVISSDGTYTEI